MSSVALFAAIIGTLAVLGLVAWLHGELVAPGGRWGPPPGAAELEPWDAARLPEGVRDGSKLTPIAILHAEPARHPPREDLMHWMGNFDRPRAGPPARSGTHARRT